jgi:hypothetical protein
MTSRSSDATMLRDLLRNVGLEDFAPDGPVTPVAHAERSPESRDLRPSRWASWGIPGKAIRLLECPAELEDTEAMRAAKQLLLSAERGKTWGLLVGGKGSGKSTAAGWWLVNVRSRGGGPRMFIRSQDIAALPPGTVYAEERLQKIFEAGALVLDDIGRKDGVVVTDPVTGHEIQRHLHVNVQRVLDAFYDSRRPLFCTSNLHPTRDFLPYLEDERSRDRWTEIGEARASREQSMRGRDEP